MDISVFSTPEEIEAHGSDLDTLARNSIEANVSYEWWALAPALRFLGEQSEVIVVVIWGNVLGIRTAIGLFPLLKLRRYSSLPIRYYELWRHKHCLLCCPLIHRGEEQDCLEKLFSWADKLRAGPYVLNLQHIPLDGPFTAALRKYAASNQRPMSLVASHQRAFLSRGLSSEEYIKKLPKKRRKELGRLARRLGEAGQLSAEILVPGAPAEAFTATLEKFLSLEAGGWKGESNTAIAKNPNELAYFHSLTDAARKKNCLSLVKLCLDGNPIAMQCNLHAGEGAFSYKLAFDEAHSRASPGILVAFENLKYVLDKSGLAWMDSGAEPDHPMIDRLWFERRTLGAFNVMLRRPGGRLAYLLIFMGKMLYKLRRRFSTRRDVTEEHSNEHSEDRE